MQQGLIFLTIYWWGRLLFFPMDSVLGVKRIPLHCIGGRVLFALLLPFLIVPFNHALIYFFFIILLIIVDSLWIPSGMKGRVIIYAVTQLAALIALFIPQMFENMHILRSSFSLAVFDIVHIHIRWLAMTAAYLFTLKEGTIIIRLILSYLRTLSENTDEHEYERGKWIGLLERTFVFFLIVLDQVGAVAIIVALKSLARFNELNNREFAEYFLIGSLLSLLIASLPAVIIRLL